MSDLDHDLSDLSDLDHDLSVRGVKCFVPPCRARAVHHFPLHSGVNPYCSPAARSVRSRQSVHSSRSSSVYTAEQREIYISSPSLRWPSQKNTTIASRPIHTNSKQCSSSARRVRLLYSHGCVRKTITDD